MTKPLDYYDFQDYTNENFNKYGTYLRISDGPTIGTGLYINKNNQLVSAEDSLFVLKKSTYPIKEVVCIYVTEEYSLVKNKSYNVYSRKDGKYSILNENYEVQKYEVDLFIDKEEYDKLSKDELSLLEAKITEKKESYKFELLKEQTEQAAIKLEEKKRKETFSTINKVVNTINSNLNKTTTIEHTIIPNKYKIINIVFSILCIIFSIFMKDFICLGLGIIYLVVSFFILRKKTIIKDDLKLEIDINYYERLKAQNKLSLDLLGKIKLIENELIILRYLKVSNDIIKLLKQNINLTIFISTNVEYYSKNKEKIDNQLDEFLDNTIKYINTLKENRQIEDAYIEGHITKDILTMIDKNNDLLKDLIKDNHYLVDIYNNSNIVNKSFEDLIQN